MGESKFISGIQKQSAGSDCLIIAQEDVGKAIDCFDDEQSIGMSLPESAFLENVVCDLDL